MADTDGITNTSFDVSRALGSIGAISGSRALGSIDTISNTSALGLTGATSDASTGVKTRLIIKFRLMIHFWYEFSYNFMKCLKRYRGQRKLRTCLHNFKYGFFERFLFEMRQKTQEYFRILKYFWRNFREKYSKIRILQVMKTGSKH
jgi:hypothetical protein